ncbi:MAG: hypothetical protein KC652_21080 [Cyanobacteria bacterium HKST-UBA01]|nr:hypothetical protein [Cyanobacteria bacterium HKST-UBA01]
MPIVRGWLYVSRKTATFVSDERSYLADQLNWESLATPERLEQFLARFVPLEKEDKLRHARYYIEADEEDLEQFFKA